MCALGVSGQTLMPLATVTCHYRYMHPVPLPGRRQLVRRGGGRIIGGVAGGLADHIGLDVFKVRLVFVLLAALAGAGFVAYGLLWVFTPGGTDTAKATPAERRQAYGLALLGFGVTAGLSWILSGTAAEILLPIAVVACGVALVWREFDADGPRSAIGLPAQPSALTWSRICGGAALMITGLGVMVLARIDLRSLGSALLAVAVTLIGAALLTIPLWLRMLRALNAERAARIRNEEREEIASHLHDSVLQTLALIQRQAADPAAVTQLARSQERELRKWLFSEPELAHSSLNAALRTIAGEVEDAHGVKITPVIVGDTTVADEAVSGPALTKEQFTALLGAAREALVNAAKHAGVNKIDLYAETETEQVSIFVRDRGAGFDVDMVADDRQGLAKSVRGRVERRGGRVLVRSAVGKGTEVRIHMPHKDTAISAAPRPAAIASPAPSTRLVKEAQ